MKNHEAKVMRAPKCKLCGGRLGGNRKRLGVCSRCIHRRGAVERFANDISDDPEYDPYVPDPRGAAIHRALLEGATLRQIGAYVGLTGERIRQLHNDFCACEGISSSRIRAQPQVHPCKTCPTLISTARVRCDACIQKDREDAWETLACSTCGEPVRHRKFLRNAPSRKDRYTFENAYCNNECFYGRKLGDLATFPCKVCGVQVETNPHQRYLLRKGTQTGILCSEHKKAKAVA